MITTDTSNTTHNHVCLSVCLSVYRKWKEELWHDQAGQGRDKVGRGRQGQGGQGWAGVGRGGQGVGGPRVSRAGQWLQTSRIASPKNPGCATKFLKTYRI